MIGAIIGGALSLGSAIYGGIKASEAMKKANANVERQQRENQDWYDRRYNEDATQRADAQRILNITAEQIKQRNKAAAGTAAVMGGTEESVAATKQANAQAMADAASQIAVAGEKRKDDIENQYMQRRGELTDRQSQIERDKAAAITQAVGGAASAAGNLAGLF